MSLLITTGATITFKSLVLSSLSNPFINSITHFGISHIYFQYGNEKNDVSLHFLTQCLSSNDTFHGVTLDNSGCGVYKHRSLVIEFFPFSHDLDSYINKCDFVISHGGTGTILDVLKLNKKLLVVYNESLMDNHQFEVASEFYNRGYCLILPSSELANVGDMLSCLQLKSFNRFDQGNSTVLESIIIEEVSR